MRMKINSIALLFIVIACTLLLFWVSSLYTGAPRVENAKPYVIIDFPKNGYTASGLLIVHGKAFDKDNDSVKVEIRIDDDPWKKAEGFPEWSIELDTRFYSNGEHAIFARAYDGKEYSKVMKVSFLIENEVEKGSHRWALFVAVANRVDVETKLGNGCLWIAEEMARYFINNFGYPPHHITILFDDGWIRSKNGEGEPVCTLQERDDRIAFVSYGAATKDRIEHVISDIVDKANQYIDSEVFIWFTSHGVGDTSNKLTGGKILEHSEILTWDSVLSDDELGELLAPLKAKTCIIIDACYSGGFADRTIFNMPSLTQSDLPAEGRIVITGTSKFSIGYASTTKGPVFTQLWFEGIKTKRADGFKRGLLGISRPSLLRFFRDGKVSVEEAFYYARYKLRTEYKDFFWMQPQMNDRYPSSPPFGNIKEMFLGS